MFYKPHYMRIFNRLLLMSAITLFCSCSTKKIKDVDYLKTPVAKTTSLPKLNVFVPRSKKYKSMPVLIFVHGGNWNTGNKNIYGFLGRNFAKKGVVTILPDYTLSPNANYDEMTKEIAAVIQWAKQNCAKYNGDANRIYVTGHSAGGHLTALAVMNPKYGINPKDVSGIILNDAAGLDMKNYLEDYPPTNENNYLATWTDNPDVWQDASPIYFLNKNTPPFLIYVGDKTYESIKTANERFLTSLKPIQPKVKPIHINKGHIPMVLQYFWPWSNRYDEIIEFMNGSK